MNDIKTLSEVISSLNIVLSNKEVSFELNKIAHDNMVLAQKLLRMKLNNIVPNVEIEKMEDDK